MVRRWRRLTPDGIAELIRLLGALSRPDDKPDGNRTMLTLLESVYVQPASVRSGFRLPRQRDTLVHIETAQPSVIRSRHQARPGRRALVARDLDVLRGPDTGQVELPVRLFWCSPDRHFDLDDDDQRAWLYETVLRQASPPEDLTI